MKKTGKNLFYNTLLEFTKNSETLTKPLPGVKPGVSPSPQKRPNPLMPPKEAPKPSPKATIEKITDRYKQLSEKEEYIPTLSELLETNINEASIDQLNQQFVETGKVAPEVFNEIIKVTGNKGAYATWMIKRVEGKEIKEEDIYKYEDYFKIFERYKREFPSQDINFYRGEKNVREFEKVAISLRERDVEHTGGDTSNAANLVPSNGIQELSRVGITFLGTVSGFQCFKIPQHSGEDAWKMYTKWLGNCAGRDKGAKIEICTFATLRYFLNYTEDGPLYVFYNLGDPKSPYQFSYESNQFMDKNDRSII